MTETIETKGQRLAAAGAVHTEETGERLTIALVQGDTGNVYRVTRSQDGVFEACTCPALARCSHIHATEIVAPTDQKGPHMSQPSLHGDAATPETAEFGPEDLHLPARPSGTDTAPQEDYTGPEAVEAALLPVIDAPVTYQTLRSIAKTDFVPAALRGRPEAILAAVLYGREMGLPPMASLSHVDMIDGRPSPSAELLGRLIRSAGGTIEVLEASEHECRLRGTRADTGETLEVSFGLDDAERAGLVDLSDGTPRARSRSGHPKPWETYTADLLWARAITRLHRRLFPDITALQSFRRKDAHELQG